MKYKQSLSSLSNVFDFILDINILLKHHNINTTWMFNIYKYNYILYTITVHEELFYCTPGVILVKQCTDSTHWTGCLMVSIIIHDTVWMLISCPHQHCITCTNDKIHSFNVLLQVMFESIPILWIYSSLLWTTETVKHTSAQSIRTFSALILVGD